MAPRAVVLGTELPRAVAVIRSLGRAGIPVVVVDHRLRMPGSLSRYASESHIREHTGELTPTKQSLVGDWLFSAPQALRALEGIGAGGDVLIPTNDEYLQVVSRHHARLSERFALTCPDWDVLEPLMDKLGSYRLAAEAGLQVPQYFTPASVEEMEAIASRLDFASRSYVLKLDPWSRGPADPRSKSFTRAGGPDAVTLVERCRDILIRVGCLPIIQEIVPGGTDRCIGVTMVVDREQQPVLSYCTRRLELYPYARSAGASADRHPYELGANVYAESIHDAEAVAAATALVRRAGYHGTITVEFRRDADDGRLKFIKADVRVVNSVALSTALGLDVPLALYRLGTGEPTAAYRDYSDGIAWIWIERYLRALRENKNRRPLLAVLRWAHRFRAFGFLSATDPKPFLRALRQELHHMQRPKRTARKDWSREPSR
jgi:predicted ATP-grasp superfamily ATP-dependent carboligase